ncbi:GrpB family protein [Streptomyces formicae]|uniref:Dephospho-CoA kinase n=1 Tax=Streptomyces formicae TaxID=1616117 RepID=A0A291Q4H1_9ACTN|nr:GrpB family protein [Streptomyces formicae]ATL26396.1 Dephospho-CoA kinase [Streptomyces formicae]
MPFPDESAHPLTVVDSQDTWPGEFARVAERLRPALGGLAVAVDHVGSTAVPGLAAKDCVDVQVRVASLDEEQVVPRLAAIGFRCRPEPWNRSEISFGHPGRKLVFAPPVGARRCNVHLRVDGRSNAQYALLFRDYLRADRVAREAWGAFKRRLARSVGTLEEYGRIKAPATDALMAGAQLWAIQTDWSPR